MNRNMQVGVRTWAIKQVVFAFIFGAALFISAGRLAWLGGWAYLGAFAISTLTSALTLKPELLAERSERQEGSKRWDVILAIVVALVGPIATLVVGGLDARHGWSAPLPPAVPIAAWLLAILGVLLTLWAMASNAFFSGLVRIQADRGHVVATGGPYRFVRHPGYAGAVIFDLAAPLFLGSLWAFMPAAATVIVLLIRTALEDRTLQAELDGYASYARQVRYRLLPGIW